MWGWNYWFILKFIADVITYSYMDKSKSMLVKGATAANTETLAVLSSLKEIWPYVFSFCEIVTIKLIGMTLVVYDLETEGSYEP